MRNLQIQRCCIGKFNIAISFAVLLWASHIFVWLQWKPTNSEKILFTSNFMIFSLYQYSVWLKLLSSTNYVFANHLLKFTFSTFILGRIHPTLSSVIFPSLGVNYHFSKSVNLLFRVNLFNQIIMLCGHVCLYVYEWCVAFHWHSSQAQKRELLHIVGIE